MAHMTRRLTSLLATVSLLLGCSTSSSLASQINRIHPIQHDSKSALVVVDARVGPLGSVWESERITGNIEGLVRRARADGVPIVWMQHSDDELKYGSAPWQLVPQFVPASSEVVIHKKFNSSFAGTDLDQRLTALCVSRMVLAGALTNWCICATAYAALDRGFDLTLVSDGHSTEPVELEGGKAIPAESITTELNTVIRWISYPNVSVSVTKAADVSFATSAP